MSPAARHGKPMFERLLGQRQPAAEAAPTAPAAARPSLLGAGRDLITGLRRRRGNGGSGLASSALGIAK